METIRTNSIILPSTLKGRNIHINVIPTVCNLKNMIDKLIEVDGNVSQLKQWEKRSYKAYQIEEIKFDLLNAASKEHVGIIRNHILKGTPADFGANCIDIYLVAFVAENFGVGREKFFEYIKKSGISEKINSAQAIWQVGKGDGVYLEILHDNGSIHDWNFIEDWLKGK